MGLGKEKWQIILALRVQFYLLAMLALIAYFSYGRLNIGRLFLGRTTCPECGEEYDRPLFGVNLVTRRYERCPKSGKWHWVKESWKMKE